MIELTPLKTKTACSALQSTLQSKINFAAIQAAKSDDTVSGVFHPFYKWNLKAVRHRSHVFVAESSVSSLLLFAKQAILNPLTGVL